MEGAGFRSFGARAGEPIVLWVESRERVEKKTGEQNLSVAERAHEDGADASLFYLGDSMDDATFSVGGGSHRGP